MNEKQLSDLIYMESSKAILEEVLGILDMLRPAPDHEAVLTAFDAVVRLYEGRYPGYRACNTAYHDLHHTTETFLAMARLEHGALLNGRKISERNVSLGLIAALFHDTGYIQEEHDTQGTGAKYTVNHQERSADLLAGYGSDQGFSKKEIAACRAMILCTDIGVNISGMRFPSAEIELMARCLMASDLMAQMADRIYLEKLLFLYHEFKEGNVGDFASELHLLENTVGFFEFITERLQKVLDELDRFMISHFLARWNIEANLYQEAIEKNKHYLEQILTTADSDPRDFLRRGGIVRRVREQYGRRA